jgi:N-acetyl-gamma-glutamyl-phosphate reductase
MKHIHGQRAARPAGRPVGIVGASGYVGRELVRLLDGHPALTVASRMSSRAGVAPEPPESELEAPLAPLDVEGFSRLQGVFLCTPHGAAAPLARAALAAGCKVVDLSADFRLKDLQRYEQVYGQAHPAPELCAEAVYGLTEHAREALDAARLVANPGCYPTSVLLALKPLLEAGAIDARAHIVADCKSGLSGAGKTPSAKTHFGAVHEDFQAYGVGDHRHAPEIHQEAGTERVVFVPHLLPVFRGILSTIYVTPSAGLAASDLRAILATRYEGERFVRVLERSMPKLSDVQLSNRSLIGLADAWGQVVIVSVLDNLVKGAAGQAIQNMNRMLGIDEGAGLS